MRNFPIACFLLALLFCSLNSIKAQNCMLPVVGGTATSSQLTSCPSMSFNISVTGGSTGTGLSYQWESSPDNTNWSVMPGITTSNLFTPQSATTWYRRKTICDAGGSAYSSSIQITANNFLTCYCTPSHSNCAANSITNVNFGSINNTSACGTNGYTDYTATVTAANVMQGAYMPIGIAVTNATSALFIDCYVDYNQDGLFDVQEQTRISSPVGNMYNGFIKVPFNAKTGVTRMRITYSAGSYSPCYPTPSSETEDYHINITPNTTAATGHVIYVKANAPGSNGQGNSWTNAITTLRDALAIATPGDTIKMASGIYYSGAGREGTSLQDSVFIFGGYPNTGSPTNADRNFSINQTILSGQKSSTDPASHLHVLMAKRLRACTLDGLIIQNGGTANGTLDERRGGGLFIENSAGISVRNCVIRANVNQEIFFDGSAFFMHNSSASFTNCIVTGNSSSSSTIMLKANSQASFTNLLAARNGGGYLADADSSSIVFRNSTIAANKSNTGLITAANQTQVTFVNSITYYNSVFNLSFQSTNYDSSDVDLFNSTASFQHSLMQVANNGTNLLLGVSPKFKDTGSVAGPDGFYFTADDGFTLTNPCSPALNAGSNTDAAGIATDITGAQRIFGAKVDLGAYELQQAVGAIPKVIYVNPAATGANNGTSWANAFTDLHKALQVCSDTIKMAAGTYQPWKSAINPSYYEVEGRRIILGAYPANGNPTNADRNYQLHLTKIDGLTNSGKKAVTVLRGRNLDSTSVLDGLVFTNTGDLTYQLSDGAVVYVECNNPVISNCSFTGNVRRIFWGKNNKNPLFDHCRIYNNISTGDSYSLDWVVLTNSRHTTFRGCTFEDNRLPTNTSTSGEFGRIMELQNTDAVIDSCRFIQNRGAVLVNTHSAPTVTNSSFLNNEANEWTTDVINRFSDPVFNNCVFQDSAWGVAASVRYGGIMNNYVSNPVFTNCRFINGNAKVGGVAFNDSSNAKFTNCVFLNNNHAFYNTNSSNIELTNCISERGAAINEPSFMHNVRSSPVLKNCVVVNSIPRLYSTTPMRPVMLNEAGSDPQIHNSVFWKNFTDIAQVPQDAVPVEIENLGNSQPQVQHSMFEIYNAGSTGNNTTGIDPRFKNYLDPDGLDNTWFTADDGLQLCDCSPAINSGDNALIAQQPTDVGGRQRIFGNAVDRGAYELQTAPVAISKTSYVNATASAGGDGSSWTNAYMQLHAALNNACSDTIKMAAGIYKPAVQNRDSSFSITRNLVLLGSYNAAGNTRDVDAHATIISGDIGNANDTSDNSLALIKSFYVDSLVIDGIVVKDANQNVAGAYGSGGILRAEYLKYFSLTNSRFYNNYSNTTGGALYLYRVGKYELQKTVFSGNKAVIGAGVYVLRAGAGSKMVNCVFDSNEAVVEGGGVLSGGPGISFINCMFSRNKARRGAGMLLNNNPDVAVINCTFSDNLPINGGFEGVGIYSSGGGLGPEIANCIFTGNGVYQMNYQDIYHPKNNNPPDTDLELRVHHSAVSTSPENYLGMGLISPGSIVYKNRLNPIGPDGKWFTADDGLQLSVCSNGIDDGSNAMVTVQQDLAGNARIFNSTVDMGAYEFNGSPVWSQLLNAPSNSLTANKEITDALGWTHYYKDCQYLMSIKKAGQNIGTVGDGTFELKVSTGPGYQSGAGKDLSSATYNTSGLDWHVMHRYWNITSTNAVQDSILIRFPYSTTDINDIKGSNPSLSQHSQLEFFKVNGTNDPFNLSIAAADFFRYTHAATPSKTTWSYSQQDSTHLAEYYVQSFNAGGGGAQFNNTLPDLVVSSASVSPGSTGSGGTVTVSFKEENITTIRAAGPHKVHFYLSADNVLTAGANGDVLLATHDIALLNASSNTGILTKPVTIPCATVSGNYFLFVVADGQSTVAETNEWNNDASVPLVVSAPPTINLTASATAICQGSSVNLSATGATTYAWTGEGLSATAGNAVSATPTTLGDLLYTVTGTVNGCPYTATIPVKVNPNPVVDISPADTSICPGNSVTLTASGATTYAWSPATGLNTASGTVVIANPAATTTYTVTGSTNGCSATATRMVQVKAAVTPAVNVDVTGCPGTDLNFTAKPVNGGSSPQFEWYVNNIKQGTGPNFTLNDAKNDMQVYVKMISNAVCAPVQPVNSPTIDINCVLTPNAPVNGVEIFGVTPNPSDGLINIQMKTQGARIVSFKLIDANGNVVYARKGIEVNGSYTTQIDIRGRNQGIYYLLTTVDLESFVRTIMVVR